MIGHRRPILVSERPERAHILWLTLLLMAAYLPLTVELAPQITLFVALIWLLRLAAVRWPATAPGTWILVALTLLGAGNALLNYQGWSGRDAGTALFVSMMTLKLLELRRIEDLRLLTSLIGFLIVVQFLFDQAPWRLAYLAGVALGMLTLLVMLNGDGSLRRSRVAAGVAFRLALQALPLTLLLFVLFPRLSAPLWSLGVDQQRATTGISDSLEFGAISELVINGELAFRVRFASAPPPPDQLYWRGPVLWNTDGRRWSPGISSEWRTPATALAHASDFVGYEVTLEPTSQRWWFALDLPVTAPAGASLSADHQLLGRQSVDEVVRYQVRSALRYQTGAIGADQRAAGLQVPANVTPRMRHLVAQWREQGGSDWGVVEQALAHFNREAFHYTLVPPLLGANPVDEFLFETKRGFCEHYASSFAVLMRLAGIPSRIVLGYLGGEPNRIGGYHMVWQSDAHAWSEVWIEEAGWVRVDPTSAVDPSRVDNREASRMLGAGSSVRFTLEQADALARLARQLKLIADSLDAAWKDWVLGFSIDDQLAILEQLRLAEFREYGLLMLLVPAVAFSLGILALGVLRERRPIDPLEAAYARFCNRLGMIGLKRRPSEGPGDYARRVIMERPDLAPWVERFVSLYVPARYGTDRHAETLAELTEVLRGFHPRRHHSDRMRPLRPG